MSTFVLVHGAFRGGWAWSRIVPLLAGAGHVAYAPDLSGAGDRYAGDEVVHLGDWVSDVIRVLHEHDLDDVVLVGHSQGGVVTAAVSQVEPDRVQRLVFLDAAVPTHRQCAADLLPKDVQARFGPPPPLEMWVPPRPTGNGWIDERLHPTPVRPAYDRVALDDPRALAIPRTYVFFGQSPDTTPAFWLRQRLDADGTTYEVLDADHDAPLTSPVLVAECLLRLSEPDARDARARR